MAYYNISGAYFSGTPGNLTAVSSATTLAKLKSGALSSTKGTADLLTKKTTTTTPKTTTSSGSSSGGSTSTVNANTINAGYASALAGNPVSLGTTPTTTPTTTQTSGPSTDLKNLSIGLAGGTGNAVQTSGGTETPAQTVARVSSGGGGNTVIPSTGTSSDLTNLSIGLAGGTNTTPTTPGAQQGVSPEEYAKSIMDAMQGMQSTYSPEQSTQGSNQQQTNDQMAPMATQGNTTSGGVGGVVSTPATGGYTKIGPAYFQKSSDGLRAVSDATVIKGLKAGTIPYSTGQLDGTTFSKYSVPLADPAKQAVADATLRAMGLPAEGDAVNEGASLMTTYESLQNKYGITQGQTDFFSDPMKTITDITTQIYDSFGMNEANSSIKQITEDLEDLENKRDDEIADINDNPWLTEGVRLRQIASVESRYEDKIANRTNKLRLLEDVRNNAQQQAQFAIGTAISLWDKERTFQQNQIDMWNEQAQNEFNNKVKLAELSMKGSGNSTIDEYLFAVENGFQGSIIDYQASVASATRAPGSGDGGLSNAQMNSTINQITGAFDNEPIVREYNTVTAGLNFIRSLGNTPTDDQARIYQFAKIMDPNSAVREGEYATVQEYSTALLQRYGINAKRVFTNTGILTPEARSFLLNTLEKRYAVSQGQYNNLQQQYQGRINNVMNGGFNSLPDYTVETTPKKTNMIQLTGPATPQNSSMVPTGVTSSGLGYTVY